MAFPDPDFWFAAALYGGPVAGALLVHAVHHKRVSKRSIRALGEARAAGLSQPASLHPRVDPALCLGCATCVPACPEGDVLGLIDRKAVLVNPTHCIGHGACRDACPQGAIELVLGTESRGVAVPRHGADFQTNVPGLFVAGEVGGMGLVRNAVEQGRQAVEAIADRLREVEGDPRHLDLVIVGAGPAGLAASLAARQHRLRFVLLEQDSFGGSIAHYPRGKIVMTSPVELPGIGRLPAGEASKETLLEIFQRARERAGIDVREREAVASIRARAAHLEVATTSTTHLARSVLLAIGRRGSPRKLGVPGEELAKVVYRLVDPEQYRGRRVLVVGGGDSAIEAALALSAQPGTRVTLSYRSESFSRAKPANRERLESALREPSLDVLAPSTVARIEPTRVMIDVAGEARSLANDAVIVCAGGVLPTAFLEAAGIDVVTLHGEPIA